MLLIEFSYLSNETNVKFEHVYGFKYVHCTYGNPLITQSCFETMVFYFTCDVGKVQIVT